MKIDTKIINIPIMGNFEVSKEEFINFLLHQQKIYNFKYELTCTLDTYLNLVYIESKIENVRPDIVVAQAIHETGYFNFCPPFITHMDNNFAGIGVTGNKNSKISFYTAQLGIKAHVQHLKAYASVLPLVNKCVDPRFYLVDRGSSPFIENLSGKWAVPGYNKSKYLSLDDAILHNDSYGQNIYKIILECKKYNKN
jgi:hypothetical protein